MRPRLLLANVWGILRTQRGECGSIALIIGLLTELKKISHLWKDTPASKMNDNSIYLDKK